MLQDRAELRVAICRLGDFHGGGEWDLPFLYAFDQAFFATFEQEEDVVHILRGQPGFADDGFCLVAALAQRLNIGQHFQRPVLSPGNVFGQAHDEGVFIIHLDHQGRDVRFAKELERIQPALATNQQIA